MRVLAPHVVLRRRGEHADQPVILGGDRIDPTGRAASACDLDRDVDEGVEPVFEATEAPWLNDPIEAGIDHLVDALLRHPPIGLGALLTLAEVGNDRPRPRDQLRGRHRCLGGGRVYLIHWFNDPLLARGHHRGSDGRVQARVRVG